MTRQLLIAGILATVMSQTSAAQTPGLPTTPGNASVLANAAPVAAGPQAHGGGHTIWDVLGVHQVGDHLHQFAPTIKSMALFHYAHQVADPMLTLAGLKPGTAPGAFGAPGGLPGAEGIEGVVPEGPPSAQELAATLAEEQDPVNVQLKVKAIRFLSQQDCICYPEVVDALLAALDDCAEVVRFEALQALRFGCTCGDCLACGGQRISSSLHGDCLVCSCQEKVLLRLSDLLLERDVRGQLRERSPRVRLLSRIMIQECLNATPVEAGSQAEPDPIPQPDPNFSSRRSSNTR